MVNGLALGLGLPFVAGSFNYLTVGDLPLSHYPQILNLLSELDIVGYILSFTALVIWLVILSCFYYSCGVFLISLSVLSSIVCFCSASGPLFWVSYEVSIVCLLFKIYEDSPYSERLPASWYFVGYFVVTSLPLLMCVVSMCIIDGFVHLGLYGDSWSLERFVLVSVMFICFVMKMPAFPFHSWLPMVHAEAPQVVSICLSGYIMKLGIFGVYRFCGEFVASHLFSGLYTFIVLFSCVSFFAYIVQELDGKRWLAFLSLGHMGCCCYAMCVSSYSGYHLAALNCLGHGLSSAMCFISLGILSGSCNSRSFLVFKSCFSRYSIVSLVVTVSICYSCSFPPTFSFFCEVLSLSENLYCSFSLILVFCLYMVLGGTLPLFSYCCAYRGTVSPRLLSGVSYGGINALVVLIFLSTLFPLLIFL